MNKLVLCAWLLSGALEVWRLRLRWILSNWRLFPCWFWSRWRVVWEVLAN